jgi:DMSO reductase anchor subunit
VCPFDAPRFNPASGLVEKCTFCSHRLEVGEKPVCVQVCPTGALDFIDLTDGGDPSDLSNHETGFVPSNAGPAVRFTRSTHPPRPPENSADRRIREPKDEYELPADITNRLLLTKAPASRIQLSSEWTLLVFTFVEALLVGVWFARLPFLARADSPGSILVPLPVIVFTGFLILGLSALHLGRPGRAWRAILNFRGSWLSREVVFYSLFVALAAVMAVTGNTGAAATGICAALGAAALIATDSLYRVTRAPGATWHSAQTLLTAVQIGGLCSGNVVIFGAMCALKTFLYLLRKYGFHKRGKRSRPWLTRLRIVTGLAAPLVLWWYGSPAHYPYIVMLTIAGEFIDRIEFYLELDLPSPAGQMAADLETAVKTT